MSSARNLLSFAEAQDHYLAKCDASPLNAEARRTCIYTPSFLSDEDAERLTTIVRNTDLLKGTDTVILSRSADNGYPHTRPKALICLPAGFVKEACDEELKETLCHEAMHIHQRRFPKLWKEMCIAQGWTPLLPEDIPLRFRERCRINPDTCNDVVFWAWDSFYVPLPMFKPMFAGKLSLGDVNIEWFDLRTGALFHSPPDSFTKKFGSPSQPEHPYEIYAVLFSQGGISTHLELGLQLKQMTLE